MENELIIMWIAISVFGLLILGVIVFLVYVTWFDNRLRVVIIDSKSGVKITKVKTKFDNRFSLDNMMYTIDKEAVYRRFVKIPYSFYFINNPNPIKFLKQDRNKKDKTNIIYTSQELHDLLDVNMTLNLIKPKVNIKKIAIGTTIVIVIGVILVMILHFTGVIDVQSFMLQQAT